MQKDFQIRKTEYLFRGGSRAAATSKMEHFGIIVNGLQCSILDVAAALDPPLIPDI